MQYSYKDLISPTVMQTMLAHGVNIELDHCSRNFENYVFQETPIVGLDHPTPLSVSNDDDLDYWQSGKINGAFSDFVEAHCKEVLDCGIDSIVWRKIIKNEAMQYELGDFNVWTKNTVGFIYMDNHHCIQDVAGKLSPDELQQQVFLDAIELLNAHVNGCAYTVDMRVQGANWMQCREDVLLYDIKNQLNDGLIEMAHDIINSVDVDPNCVAIALQLSEKKHPVTHDEIMVSVLAEISRKWRLTPALGVFHYNLKTRILSTNVLLRSVGDNASITESKEVVRKIFDCVADATLISVD